MENSQFYLCLTDIRTMHGVKEWYHSPDVLNTSLMFFASFYLFADKKKNNPHFTSTKILQTNFRRTQSQKSHPHFVDCFTVPPINWVGVDIYQYMPLLPNFVTSLYIWSYIRRWSMASAFWCIEIGAQYQFLEILKNIFDENHRNCKTKYSVTSIVGHETYPSNLVELRPSSCSKNVPWRKAASFLDMKTFPFGIDPAK